MEIPKGLSYRRCLETSEAFFFSENKEQEVTPIILQSKTLVGPFSDIASVSGTNKKNINAMNIFRTDLALLPSDCQKLIIICSLIILQSWRLPYRCESSEVKKTMKLFMEVYEKCGGFDILAEAYAENILNLIWCWRNNEVFRTGRVCEVVTGKKKLTFRLPDNTHKPDINQMVELNTAEKVNELIAVIHHALTGNNPDNQLQLTASFQAMPGREVYPSQEFVEEGGKGNDDKIGRGRVLACSWTSDNKRLAVFHKTKISHALHNIDCWYENTLEAEPINVNPLGYDQSANTAYRSWNSGMDLYHLLMEIESITEDMVETNQPSPNAHFIAANLLRGGLFTAKKTVKKEG